MVFKDPSLFEAYQSHFSKVKPENFYLPLIPEATELVKALELEAQKTQEIIDFWNETLAYNKG